VYAFYCGCDNLYQWSFTRKQQVETALTCDMTHVIPPQLPSPDKFAAWYRVCKQNYLVRPGECDLSKAPPPPPTRTNSTNSTDATKEGDTNEKKITTGEGKQGHKNGVDLGDTVGNHEPHRLHHKFFSKREGTQQKSIAYRLGRWERRHRSDCTTSGASCKTKLAEHANSMIQTAIQNKALDGFKYMRGFNTWYEYAQIPGGYDCSAFFAFGVSVCNKGGTVSVRCDIDGEETKGYLDFGCGCNGVYLQGDIMGYMPASISRACAHNMQLWTQKAEQSFMRTSQAEKCVARAARKCRVWIDLQKRGKQMVKDKGLMARAKKQISLHQVVRTISKENDEAEKEKTKLMEQLANPVYTYVKIPGFGVHASGVRSSQRKCQDRCDRQAKCKAFSYNKHTEGCALSGTTIDVNDNYVLYTRQNAPEWDSTTFTEIPGMSFAPDDAASGTAVSASQCKLDCLSNKDCNAVSYSKPLMKCLISKAGLHLGSEWDYYEKTQLKLASSESMEKNHEKLQTKEMKIKVLIRTYKVGVEADNRGP